MKRKRGNRVENIIEEIRGKRMWKEVEEPRAKAGGGEARGLVARKEVEGEVFQKTPKSEISFTDCEV